MKALVTRMFKDAIKVGGIAMFLATVSGILMFHVWNQYQILEVGYEIADVTHAHRRLIEQNKKLSIEAAVLGSTERLSTVARERYGLEPVRPEQVRTLSMDVADDGVAVEQGKHAALLN